MLYDINLENLIEQHIFVANMVVTMMKTLAHYGSLLLHI